MYMVSTFGVSGAASSASHVLPPYATRAVRSGPKLQHLHLRTDVERRLQRRVCGGAPLPALQPYGSGHAEHASDQPLQWNRTTQQGGQPTARNRETDDE
jgi:hypothetical protein